MCYWTMGLLKNVGEPLRINLLEQQFIPVKTLKVNRKNPIWMTHKVLRAVSRKRKVYRKYKDANHPAYVQAERKAKSLIRTAKREFERKLAKKIKEDRK